MEVLEFFKNYFNVDDENIAYSKEALNENTEIFVGDLNCKDEALIFYPNLKVIIGDAYFNNLVTAIGLDNLSYIIGSAFFHSLKRADGLEKLKLIDGDAFFDMLVGSKGIKNLDTISGMSYFGSLRRSKYIDNINNEGPLYTPRIRKKKVR